MCESPSDIRADLESYAFSVLCEECTKKVERKLEGAGKNLFDFAPEEYGMCEECLEALDKIDI